MTRNKEDRVQKCYRIHPATPKKLSSLAIVLGYIYGKKETGESIPATGQFLDAIANGDIILTVSPRK